MERGGGLHSEVSVHAGGALHKSTSQCALTGFLRSRHNGRCCWGILQGGAVPEEGGQTPNPVWGQQGFNPGLCNLTDVPAC